MHYHLCFTIASLSRSAYNSTKILVPHVPYQPLWTAIKGEYLVFNVYLFIHCSQYRLKFCRSQHHL